MTVNGSAGAIMVVDDNEPSRDALSRRFQRCGYRTLPAGDGAEALAVAHRERLDLILMDLGLPGMDGREATRRLKQDPVTGHIPVIVLSAHAMTNDRDLAIAAGADDFDTKPVRFRQLLVRIDTLLKKAVIVR
jgi:two-component system cell cycle response regulator DivK